MTISVGPDDFTPNANIDPGGGLHYTSYTATQQSAYMVSIAQAPFYIDYFVFGIGGAVGLATDTVFAGQPGTFETADGDDILVNTTVLGSTPAVRLFGGADDDQINPLSQIDTSGVGPTEAYGGSGADTVNGGNGADTLYGDTANSFVGNPLLTSVVLAFYDPLEDGDDIISGYGGADTLHGNGGDDQLFGGEGADTLSGGAGSDFLFGGPRGAGDLDVLTGGTGADAFLLSYSQDSGNPGVDFWSGYFAKMSSDIAGNVAKVIIQDAIKGAADGIAGGILAGALGAAGDDLVVSFVDFVEALLSGDTPASPQDVMVVTDFDPSEDVLILPLQDTVLDALTVSVVTADQVPGLNGSSDEDVLQFKDGNTTYAYVALSADYLDELGLGKQGPAVDQVLKNLFAFSSGVAASGSTVGFTNLLPASISDNLPGGGFQAQTATLPLQKVAMFGAVGGTIVANAGDAYGSVLAGTDYVDALTTNPKLVDPATLIDFAGTSAYINGFGGDDLIYGTDKADTLIGGDGNDLLYSLVSTVNSGPGVDPEVLTGGGGNDTLYGGGSAGQFDAGDGTDTFAVLYLNSNPALQLEVDLVEGYAAENTAPSDTTAPAGDTPPFMGTGPDKVINNYSLTGFENAIGGPLNDWIRGASGSVIEGGPGADYLDAKAGGVTITYAGSATGVNVLLDDVGSSAGGGDAQGDVIGYATTEDVAELVGTAGNDTLGGYTSDTLEDGGQGFVMQGGGGEDVFTILGFNGSGVYVLPDFTYSPGEQDVIDLRPIGVTSMAQVTTGDGMVTVTSEAGGSIDLVIGIPGFGDTLPGSAFLFATQISGTGRARPGDTGLVGGAGADRITGSGERDTLLGRGGADLICGRLGDDRIDGGAGNDTLSGGAGNDRIVSGEGNDAACGGRGDDRLSGEDGADILRGGAGRDLLSGGAGNDRLFGGAGDDTLDGGPGSDHLRGGRGADSFMLRFGEIGGDAVLDFSRAAGDRLLVLADHPVTVQDQGCGFFLISDGTVSEMLMARGAAIYDFIL